MHDNVTMWTIYTCICEEVIKNNHFCANIMYGGTI
jgi:hypothetical protein